MSQDNYALLTRTGRLKEAQRMAGQTVPAITHMAFGDMDRAPTGGETALGHEVHRAALTGWGAYADQTAAFFDCYLPAAIGGFVIREVGLIDAAGDLIAIARRSPGLPKTTPENGGGDDFTLRIDVFLEDLDTLVVTVSPIAGLTADNLRNFLYPNNLPVEAVLSSAPGAPIAGGQWIVAPNPTGIWAGRTGQIARWRGAWEYETPRAGRMANYWTGVRFVTIRFDGTAWGEWLASTEAAGPVELATDAETQAGTDATRAVTPASLRRSLFRLANADIAIAGWLAVPPGSPAAGAIYVVAPGASGAWAGHVHEIATWLGGAWAFSPPVTGLQANYVGGGVFVVLWFDGAVWKIIEKHLGRLLIFGAGAGSWECPQNVTSVRARGRGAGGGGGGSTGASLGAGGGSGGSYFDGVFAVVPGTAYPFLVGGGGPGGIAAGTSGTNGGLTSFGSFATAPGGLGSLVSNSVPTVGAASPANAAGGQVNWKGCPGGNAFNGGGQGGPGGGSYGQGSINNPPIGGGNGIPGLLPGVGGNGGGNVAPGGAGADGELILEF